MPIRFTMIALTNEYATYETDVITVKIAIGAPLRFEIRRKDKRYPSHDDIAATFAMFVPPNRAAYVHQLADILGQPGVCRFCEVYDEHLKYLKG